MAKSKKYGSIPSVYEMQNPDGVNPFFIGHALTMARQLRGLAVTELAMTLGISDDDITTVESSPPGLLLPRETEEAIATALDFPIPFFHQMHESFGMFEHSSMEWHDKLVYCECGHALAEKGEELPLICPVCLGVVEGCPRCDHDLEAVWARGGDDRVSAVKCPQCGYRRRIKGA